MASPTAEEITHVKAVVAKHLDLDEHSRFVYVGLIEPPKAEVLAYEAGTAPQPDRIARAMLLSLSSGEALDLRLNLTTASVLQDVAVDGSDGHIPLLEEEPWLVDPILRANDEWRAAIEKRGLAPQEVIACALSPGYYGQSGDDTTHRSADCAQSGSPPMDNTAHPPPAAHGEFVQRHFGPSTADQAKMLAEIGFASIEDLIDAAVPDEIRTVSKLGLPSTATEQQAAAELAELAAKSPILTPMIGHGYHGTVTPAVIRRNVLEDPAWYSAYTPYQPEISQDRLEALLNFQTMVGDLTGLPTADASLLDEATAVAEAVMLMRRASLSTTSTVLVDADLLPQTLAVVRTRAAAIGIEVVVVGLDGPCLTGTSSGWYPSPGAPARYGAYARWSPVPMPAEPRSRSPPIYSRSPCSQLPENLASTCRWVVGVSVDSTGRPAYRLP